MRARQVLTWLYAATAATSPATPQWDTCLLLS